MYMSVDETAVWHSKCHIMIKEIETVLIQVDIQMLISTHPLSFWVLASSVLTRSSAIFFGVNNCKEWKECLMTLVSPVLRSSLEVSWWFSHVGEGIPSLNIKGLK